VRAGCIGNLFTPEAGVCVVYFMPRISEEISSKSVFPRPLAEEGFCR
jgi:hypothetical protein